MEPAHQDKMAGLTKEDQNINNTTEDISHMASGHKANISNPSKLQHSTYSYDET